MAFPIQRLRRLRQHEAFRRMVRETRLSTSDLIYPLFVTEGKDQRQEIASMPGQFRLSIDLLVKEAGEVAGLGIPAIILFGIPDRKDERGTSGYDPNGVVQRAMGIHFESQWFADQGFAVLAIDGRGTPNRGPAWDRAVYRNLADPVLEDQVDGLHAAAERFGFLDLGRVAIRGWSFGGFLAAMAVLRRPDVFHAAVAGAPTADDALYDTHYTERYMGLPEANAQAYEEESLLACAADLQRPLLLVHGTGDDNVFFRHSLRLADALFRAGRVTHQHLAAHVSGDLAYVVSVEHHTGEMAGQAAPVSYAYRVTHVLRREAGRWRVAHRHADPLVELQEPQTLLQSTPRDEATDR